MNKTTFFLLIVILFLLPLELSAETITTTYQGAFGLQLVGGEVQTSLLRADLFYNHNRRRDYEWTAKLRSSFQSTDGQELISRHIGSLRYGKSINKKWYWFSRSDLEKDKQRNLVSRCGLVLGSGYWFSDEKDFTFFVESSAGHYTDRFEGLPLEDYNVLQLHEEADRRLFDTLRLTQEFFVTNLKDGYRYIADLGLENLLNKYWSLAFSLNYDLAVSNDNNRQESTTFIMELKFDYEVTEED